MEMQKYFSVPEIIRLVQTYRTQFLSGVLAGSLAIGGLIYWHYNRMNLEKNSLQVLSELLSEYNQAYENNNEMWQDIEIGSRTGYRQYSQSSLEPYFLNVQVDSLLQQDKFDEALLLMHTMMKKLPTKSPLYNVYAIKWARIKLASSDKANREEGLLDLQKFSQDSSNSQQLQAQYYLGMYYQETNQFEKADDIWKVLAATKGETPDVSPWVVMAQQKLR
jgi:predicted Zn-dependent protease